ncbi:MAG: sugar ABC transporter permease [Mycobacterium sp.]|nr:sugar ABC transporter permease [Mycobacterium sp.]
MIATSASGRRRRLGRWLPLLPAAVLLGIFIAGPVLWCIFAAFTDTALTGVAARRPDFIGFRNIERALTSPDVGASVWLTVVFVVGSAVIGQNGLGMLLAAGTHHRGRLVRQTVGATVISAWILPEIVAALAIYGFLNDRGPMSQISRLVGAGPQHWLYTAPMMVVIVANVWRGTAFSMLVYQAALAEVPDELIEAAQIDGAGPVHRFRHVVLPLLRRTIATNLLLITLQTIGVFTLIFVLTGGGPKNKTQTLPLLMYEKAFKFGQIGYGTAIALVLLLLAMVFSLAYIRSLNRQV